MSERKKQVWFRPDQIDLVVECLRFVKERLDNDTLSSEAHRMAGRFTYRRINDVLKLFGEPQK